MRLMAAKSIDDSRKAMMTMLLVLMPIAAIVVASGGWVGKALSHSGALPEMEPAEAFFISAEFLCRVFHPFPFCFTVEEIARFTRSNQEIAIRASSAGCLSLLFFRHTT